MKRLILLGLSIVLAITLSYAQNNVILNINHQLGTAPFSFGTGVQNNIGHDFNLSRLEYYLSKFTIVHDGGQEMHFDSLYILVKAASTPATIYFGTQNITIVEGIRFHLGVDSVTNHLDPAAYPADHPLSPQFPSMHWGWAGGYRFVAFEGKGSASYNQDVELHGLGDDNYFEAAVNLTATATNNEIILDVAADYTRAVENISLNSGVVVHGFGGAAQTMLQNFSQYVFSDLTTSTSSINDLKSFSIFPNPTMDGFFNIKLESDRDDNYDIVISDVLGKEIALLTNIKSTSITTLNVNKNGIYFIQLIQNGQLVSTKKLIAQ